MSCTQRRTGIAGIEAKEEKDYEEKDFMHLKSFEDIGKHVHIGCSVKVRGIIKEHPKRKGVLEIHVSQMWLIGGIGDPGAYAMQGQLLKEVTKLRRTEYTHVRFRSPHIKALLQVRAALLTFIPRYFEDQECYWVDPAILTKSDCEGGGDMFSFVSDTFQGQKVSLTVSSQLPLEAMIYGFGDVFTMQKSFRAEHSDTPTHLSEFLHLERETAFITFTELMDGAEDFVKATLDYMLVKCASQLSFLKSDTKALKEIASTKFMRISHADAVDMMLSHEKEGKVTFEVSPKQGADLRKEHEDYIVKHFGRPTFITKWPLAEKSFYMYQCEDGVTCDSFDLLVPKAGELFGGSMREWRKEKLEKEIAKRGMDTKDLQWFIDLRSLGSAPHGGWGMGVARMLMWITGATSVRDVVPYPVYYKHCVV